MVFPSRRIFSMDGGRWGATPQKQIDVPLKTVTLFSGAGGLDLGLRAAGFSVLFANDIDKYGCDSLKAGDKELKKRVKNFQGTKIVCADIRSVSGKDILQQVPVLKKGIQLLAGGPPCQAFSVFGKRMGRDDERGQMVDEYFRILSDLSPDVFVFENVFGLLAVGHGEVFDLVCKKLSDPSPQLYYETKVFRLNAVDYGVPQYRDRIIIIGSRTGASVSSIDSLTFANPSKDQLRYRNVADAFRGLPTPNTKYPANHTGRIHGDDIIRRYSSLAPGQRDTHTRINKQDFSRPSFTIVCGSNCGGGKGHVHPIEPREVTPRESARIQTFPDWWSFTGTSRHPIRQVGNAVPPLLAFAIGNAIRDQIFHMEKVSLTDGIRFLSQEHLFPEFFDTEVHR